MRSQFSEFTTSELIVILEQLKRDLNTVRVPEQCSELRYTIACIESEIRFRIEYEYDK